MNEQNQKTEDQRVSGEDTQGRDKPQSTSLIDDANKAAERLEIANKETALLLARQEQLMAKRALGGMSEGPKQLEKPKPLTPREYVAQLSKGIVPIEPQ